MRSAGSSVLLRIAASRRLLALRRSPLIFPSTRYEVSATAALVITGLLVALAFVALPAQPATAAPDRLTIEVDRGLSLVGEAVTLKVVGSSSEGLSDALLVVRVRGPAEA
ncbi:MAG: hypothetical protein ABH877_00520, partial [bacterium]